MNKLQKALRDSVISQEQAEQQAREQLALLDSTADALTETTSLDQKSVSAVLRNIRAEPAKIHKTSVIPELPSVSPQKIRIGIYAVLGLLGYSAYNAAQVNTLHKEQLLYSSQQSVHDLQIEAMNLQGILVSPYMAFFKRNQQFPSSIDELSGDYRTREYLDASRYFTAYKPVQNGAVRFDLTERYGYNRWIELTPKLVDYPVWDKVNFDCRSNAERHLLQNNGNPWCEYSAAL